MIWNLASHGRLTGELRVPGDKSISHRALLFSSLASGPSRIRGLLQGEDVQATSAAVQQMGVRIHQRDDEHIVTPPDGGLTAPTHPIDCGNSGTTIRLLTGLLAGQGLSATLSGDKSLCGRPMGRIVRPLMDMGAEFGADSERPPIHLVSGATQALNYDMPIASAQVKSCLLLAGLNTGVSVREPGPSRDHTERMFAHMGVPLSKDDDGWIHLLPGATFSPLDLSVPGDMSSAAFWVAAASIVSGSAITLRDVGMNPTRTGVLDVLKRMGANIQLIGSANHCGEPVASLRVSAAPLKGTTISGEYTLRSLDELPVLAVAAAFAEGVTHIRDAAELRVKESDRIALVCRGLRALGFEVEEHADGMSIRGGRPTKAADIYCEGDHRIAMAFAVAALAGAECRIHGAETVSTSYPSFRQHMEQLLA